MLGKPFVCIALDSASQSQVPLKNLRAPVLLPFLNRNALYYQLRQCRQAGLDTVLLLLDEPLYQQLESIRQSLSGLPLQIEYLLYAPEQTEWRLRLLERLNENDPVLFLQNPSLDLLELKAFIDFHNAQQADCSISLSPQSGPGRPALQLDSKGQITAKREITASGITGYDRRLYLIEPDIFEELLNQDIQLLRQALLPVLEEKAQYCSGRLSQDYWVNWQRPADFFRAQAQILEQELLEPVHQRKLENEQALVWMGENVILGNGVRFKGPVILGDQVVIEKEVLIEGPAVIGSGCRIQTKSQIQASWLWPGSQIGPECLIQQSWLGEKVKLAGQSKLEQLWAGCNSQLRLSQVLQPKTILGAFSELQI